MPPVDYSQPTHPLDRNEKEAAAPPATAPQIHRDSGFASLAHLSRLYPFCTESASRCQAKNEGKTESYKNFGKTRRGNGLGAQK